MYCGAVQCSVVLCSGGVALPSTALPNELTKQLTSKTMLRALRSHFELLKMKKEPRLRRGSLHTCESALSDRLLGPRAQPRGGGALSGPVRVLFLQEFFRVLFVRALKYLRQEVLEVAVLGALKRHHF